MWRTTGFLAGFAILFTAAIASAQDAANPRPSARELFYEAGPAASKPTPPKPANRPKQPPAVNPPAAGGSMAGSTAPATPPGSGGTTLPGGGQMIRASAETGPPLGLRYSIARLVNGGTVETSPDFIFHAGDAIQIKVQTNSPGYLYIVSKGSSGAWTPIFPSPGIAHGDNRVDGWNTYTLPGPNLQIGFDEHTGTENVTILFSRQPVPDFEELIYSLQGRPAQPSSDPAAPTAPKTKVMMASVNIDDATLGRLRNASSRDLVVEAVNPNTPSGPAAGEKKETAVYVVNRTGSENSRLVAELHLVHR